jgi:hypothetical protein
MGEGGPKKLHKQMEWFFSKQSNFSNTTKETVI